MPIITVRIAKGRSVEKKRSLVEALTRAAAPILDVPPERIVGIIDESDDENWAIGGVLALINWTRANLNMPWKTCKAREVDKVGRCILGIIAMAFQIPSRHDAQL